MWTGCHELPFLRQLLCHSLFYLDEGEYGVIPNPAQRYVVPLRSDVRWYKNKKVRRYARDFTLSLSRDFSGAMRACKR